MGSANKNAPIKSPQESVVGNCLGLLARSVQPSIRRSVARVSSPRPLRPSPLAPLRAQRPRVNVYLCIKQALFIRPMNMHCLVAVARCRVQTRRYHCLINHTQSQRSTLRVPPCFAPALYPALITPLGSPQRTRRVIPQSSPRVSSRCVPPPPPLSFSRCPLGFPRYSRCPPPTGRN